MDRTAPLGIRLSVYTNPQYRACSNGPTATVDALTVIGVVNRIEDPGNKRVALLERQHRTPFTADEKAPPVALVVRTAGNVGRILSLEPVELTANGEWVVDGHHAAGGNFAGTSDSRFTALTRDHLDWPFYGAVAVHDRKENWGGL